MWLPIKDAPDRLKLMATAIEHHYVVPKLRWQVGVDAGDFFDAPDNSAIVVFYLGEVVPPTVTQYFVLPVVADE